MTNDEETAVRETPPGPGAPPGPDPPGPGSRWPAPAAVRPAPVAPPFTPLPSVEARPQGGGWEPRGDEPASAFPVPWRLLAPLGVFLLVQFVVTVLTLLGVALLGEDQFTPIAIVVTGVANVAVALAWVQVRHPGQVRRLFGPVRTNLADAARGAGLGVLAYLGANVALSTLITYVVTRSGNELPPVQEELQAALTDPGIGLLVSAVVVLLVPLGEELLFRGMLFSALRDRVPLWPAIGLSSLVFGLTHVEPLAIVLTFPAGMLWAWGFHRRGTLVTAVVAHAVFNLINVVLLRLGLGG